MFAKSCTKDRLLKGCMHKTPSERWRLKNTSHTNQTCRIARGWATLRKGNSRMWAASWWMITNSRWSNFRYWIGKPDRDIRC